MQYDKNSIFMSRGVILHCAKLCHQLLPMYLHNTYYELPCRKKLFVTRWQFPLQLALKHTAANCFANWIKHLEPRPFDWLLLVVNLYKKVMAKVWYSRGMKWCEKKVCSGQQWTIRYLINGCTHPSYGRVYISLDEVFSKILKKPSIL